MPGNRKWKGASFSYDAINPLLPFSSSSLPFKNLIITYIDFFEMV